MKHDEENIEEFKTNAGESGLNVKEFNANAEEGRKMADKAVLPYLGDDPAKMLENLFDHYMSDADREDAEKVLGAATEAMDGFSGYDPQKEGPHAGDDLLEQFADATDYATDKAFEEIGMSDVDTGNMSEEEQMELFAKLSEKYLSTSNELSPAMKGRLYGFVREITESVLSRAEYERDLAGDIRYAKILGVVSVASSIIGVALFVGAFLPESVIGITLSTLLRNGATYMIPYFMIWAGLVGKVSADVMLEDKEQMLEETKIINLSERDYVIS